MDSMKEGDMKLVQRIVWALALVAGAALPGFSQITITAADVSGQLAVGNWVTNRYDKHTTQIDIGSAGSSSWDFSALQNDSTITLTSVDVSTSPFASTFPGATHAMRSAITYAGISGMAYLYLNLGTNLTNMGLKGVADLDANTTLVITYTPADVVYGLPSTLGTSWTSTYTQSLTFNLFGLPGTPSFSNHNYSYHVDGYGPMTLPGGGTVDALRIRRMDSTETSKSLVYMFLAKNGASAQFWLSDVNAPDHGVVGVSDVQWSAPFNTDVAAGQTLPSEVQLLQNFPNPFNPSTVLPFDLPEKSFVTLKVYNLLGSEVATLVNGTLDAGRHQIRFNASGLASGVYLYRLQAGNIVLTQRMVLLK
jgi:hypothetical protein